MSYIMEMTHNEFCSLPAYDKKTSQAGVVYRLFKIGLYNLQTETGYIKKVTSRHEDHESGSVHKVYITSKKQGNN